MCIVLKIDLSCCRACRKSVCRNLKRIAGVEQVKVGEDEATIMVCGKGFDEAEIVRQAKKTKSRSKVEVVSRIVHNMSKPLRDTDAGGHSVDADGMKPPQPKLKPKPETLEPETEAKPEILEPEPEQKLKPKPKPIWDNVEEEHPQQEERNSPRKVDTLVTERTLKESQGIKIRTRVTTSQDVCTCIRIEETRFIINKDCRSKDHSLHLNPLSVV